MRELPTGKCRWCGGPILWAVTAAGKHIPLDPEPKALEPDSHYVVDNRGVAHQIALGPFACHLGVCAAYREARAAALDPQAPGGDPCVPHSG
jgi:hypothetical protein